ncbi:hypothetical protein TIFTF001_009458 [Ficus carica]|uniref:Uncharacterized protein n=1 Tax=Ficus carica TaxID=3494 RepID=A0AA87ZN54_FICCA|nr:hypothetical protein TIFTF001_009458 [Ficus carica]
MIQSNTFNHSLKQPLLSSSSPDRLITETEGREFGEAGEKKSDQIGEEGSERKFGIGDCQI